MRAHNEDENEHLSNSHNPHPDRTRNQHAAVGKRLHGWVSEPEFANDPAGVCGDDAKEEEQQKTGDETEDGEGLGQCEDTEGNVFGQHKDARMPPVVVVSGEGISLFGQCLPFTCLVMNFGSLFIAEDVVLSRRNDLTFRVRGAGVLRSKTLCICPGVFLNARLLLLALH